MQVAFYLAGEITQVKESIPWVRCASGNVFFTFSTVFYQTVFYQTALFQTVYFYRVFLRSVPS